MPATDRPLFKPRYCTSGRANDHATNKLYFNIEVNANRRKLLFVRFSTNLMMKPKKGWVWAPNIGLQDFEYMHPYHVYRSSWEFRYFSALHVTESNDTDWLYCSNSALAYYELANTAIWVTCTAFFKRISLFIPSHSLRPYFWVSREPNILHCTSQTSFINGSGWYKALSLLIPAYSGRLLTSPQLPRLYQRL